MNGWLLTLVLITATASPFLAHAEPPLGVYVGAGCEGRDRVAGFTSWLGRKPARVLEFMSWQKMNERSTWSMTCWKTIGVKVTYSLPMLPEDGSATLAQGAAGQFDTVFRNFATTLVAQGHADAVIRIGWEFNGDWYAWAARKDPQAWVTYWRRIVAAMRGVSGANFKFDWCAAGGYTTLLAESVYPGDAYVDYIGTDVYNQSWDVNVDTPEERWNEQVNGRHGLAWHAKFAAEHGKPMSFPEWATGTRGDGHGAGDDPMFIEQMAEWIVSHDVAYHNYWDFDHPHFSGRISDNGQPKAAAAFVRKFKLPRPKPPVMSGAR